MAEIKDDPKEVLSILNSLGFVGITAPQLKSFMKDLKLYKKIKARERQAWEEEIKEKILEKQRRAFVEFIQEESRTTRHHRHEKIVTQESPRKPEALVKIKLKYSSKGKENDDKDSPKQSRSKMQKSETAPRRECDFWMKDLFQSDLKHSKTTPFSKRDCIYRSKSETEGETMDERRKLEKKSSKEDVNTLLREKSKDKGEKSESRTPRLCKKLQTQKRPTSAPEVGQKGSHVRTKSMISDPGETGSTVTKYSVQYSQHKSFIRPWRLQPVIQKSWKKSDPVALYQKYQEEWKHCPLPGEDQHSNIRWAIREKMLGYDPHPRPAMYKCASTPTLKRR